MASRSKMARLDLARQHQAGRALRRRPHEPSPLPDLSAAGAAAPAGRSGRPASADWPRGSRARTGSSGTSFGLPQHVAIQRASANSASAATTTFELTSLAEVLRAGFAQAGAVPIKDLQIVTALATKDEDMTGIGIGLEDVGHLCGQAVEAVTHADRPGREIDLGARRHLDHARSFSARNTRRRARSLTNASTRTRCATGRSTSITPGRSSSFAALPADREPAPRGVRPGGS